MASAAEVKPSIHDPDTVLHNEAADAEKKDSISLDEPHHAEDPSGLATSDEDRKHFEKYGTYDRYEITEEDCYDELGFSFPTWKKWTILSIVFLVQVSMNFNTSLYSNAVTGISSEFGVSAQAARVGAAVFLITYAFGCELWAPWSEELGRWPILQLSLFFVNIWQIPVGIAPNFATIIVCRALGGLSTAGGSVTLAMVADMWEANDQQYAVVSLSYPPLNIFIGAKHSRRPSLSFPLSAAQFSVPSSAGLLNNSWPGDGTFGSSSFLVEPFNFFMLLSYQRLAPLSSWIESPRSAALRVIRTASQSTFGGPMNSRHSKSDSVREKFSSPGCGLSACS